MVDSNGGAASLARAWRGSTFWQWTAQALVAGAALGVLAVSLVPPHCYNQDLQQSYLSARALRDGIDPLMPVSELSVRYFPARTTNFPHANPQPPVVALLFVPFSLVPFPVLAMTFLIGNVVLLVVVGRWLGFSVTGSLAWAAWPPIWWDLFIGQYEIPMLVLAMCAWRAASRGRDWRAGVCLGFLGVMKLYPVLFLVPFLVQRRWKVLAAAVAVALLGQIGSLVAVGPAGFLRYYGDVLPTVSTYYAHVGLNTSVYGELSRVFGGSTDVTPLLDAPRVVVPTAFLATALALAALAVVPPAAAPVAALVAMPSVWYYSVVLTLPALVAVGHSGVRRGWTVGIGIGLAMVLPLVKLMTANFGSLLPPPAVLLAAQPAALIGLLWILIRYRRRLVFDHHQDGADLPAR